MSKQADFDYSQCLKSDYCDICECKEDCDSLADSLDDVLWHASRDMRGK